jgi:hypothetical protein
MDPLKEPAELPENPPPNGRGKHPASLANLHKGLPEGQQKGPDGRFQRKGQPVLVVAEPERQQTWHEALDWAMVNLGQRPESAPSKRALQLWLDAEKDPEAFRKQYLPMLIKSQARGPACGQEKMEMDPGGDRALNLIEEFFARRKEQQRQEDAAFAARPDAAQVAASLQARLSEALRREQVLLEEQNRLRGQGG